MKNRNLTPFSQDLRSNMTDAERKIWRHLRLKQIKGLKFRRQQIIGHYVVDFVCLEKKLIVEIDGGQHNKVIDHARTTFLETEGYKILRFWNNDVLTNIEGVMTEILNELSPPSYPSPLKGEGIRTE